MYKDEAVRVYSTAMLWAEGEIIYEATPQDHRRWARTDLLVPPVLHSNRMVIARIYVLFCI